MTCFGIPRTSQPFDHNQYNPFALSSLAAVYANGAVDTSYDYAVPELDCANGGQALSNTGSDQDSIFSKASRNNKTEDKKVMYNLF